MTSDLDIYRAASLLIKQHGGNAPIHAARWATDMLDKCGMEGYAVWKMIRRAVEELEGMVSGAAIH